MKIELIAHTTFMDGAAFHATDGVWESESQYFSADSLAEFSGRACYQSWDKPNPKTRSNADYLKNVIDQGHESVLAHASFTFYVQDISRALTHELIRHRWLAFSELSQRYVDMEDANYVIPPAVAETEDTWLKSDVSDVVTFSTTVYRDVVEILTNKGYTRKQAREAARAVLPNCMETKIVVSGNVRAWRDFLRQRLSPHADAEIRQFAQTIYDLLTEWAPNSMYGIDREGNN